LNTLEQVQKLIDALKFLEGEEACLSLIKKNDKNHQLHFLLALSYQGQNKHENAIKSYVYYLSLRAHDDSAWQAFVIYLLSLEKYQDALHYAENACVLLPKSTPLKALLAYAYEQNKQVVKAYQCCQQVLSVNPLEPLALTRTAFLLIKLGEIDLAEQFCSAAIAAAPNLTALYDALSDIHMQRFDYAKALDIIDITILKQADNANLILKKGLALACMGRLLEAKIEVEHAQALSPDVVRHCFNELRALNAEQANLSVNPIYVYLKACSLEQAQCFWQNRNAFIQCIQAHYLQNEHVSNEVVPADLVFHMFFLPLQVHERLKLVENLSSYLQAAVAQESKYSFKLPLIVGRRIKVAYLSPDFRSHAGGFLIAQILENHHLNNVEVFAYSLQKPLEDSDAIYSRISNTCEHFLDVSDYSSKQVADKIHADGIDILVDLAGYTGKSHTEILAMRPAPIQIAYLGFVQSMHADFIDYCMVDSLVCPEGTELDWHEKLIKLPNSLYVYDISTSQEAIKKTRDDFGLPKTAFVFCCFNSSNKIEPTIFEVWMNILKRTPHSVLWLLSSNNNTVKNLRKEAESSGVDASRLIFAEFLPHKEHLQRYQLADLFLDTYWCGGHTTSLDALWQGLPIIACSGSVTSSKIASSFLQLLNLTSLRVHHLNDYIERAVHLFNHPQELSDIKVDLKEKLKTAPLFDVKLNVQYIEQAYDLAWQRYRNGLLPDHIVLTNTTNILDK